MTGRRIAHLVLILVGLAVAGFGLWRTAHPDITCRGVQMHPGEVCHKNDFSSIGSNKTQSYEQRVHAAHQSQPVVALIGLGMAAFGGVLFRQEGRRATVVA